MIRHATGFLWRFYAFRSVVIWLACHGIAAGWLFRETPFGWSLHRMYLAEGDYVEAAACARLLE